MRVLVPIDGSEQSWKALEYAEERFPSASILLLHVINPGDMSFAMDGEGPTMIDQWFDAQQDAAESMFERARERVDSEIEAKTDVGPTSRIICEHAADCDHVVIGSHGREGVSRVLLGSVAETVVRRAPVPVTVVR
ncbi:MAG: universal stress protein [Natronomonas sp.]